MITNLFGCREIQAYVTATEKEHGTKRLFFSTIFPEDLQIFCAWQEKEPLNHGLMVLFPARHRKSASLPGKWC